MAFTADRLLALAIATGYLIAAAVLPHPGVGGVVMLAVILLVPLVMIWFPEIGTSWPTLTQRLRDAAVELEPLL